MENESIVTQEELSESNTKADDITEQINDNIGHWGLLAFERSAVDV